MGEEKKPEEDKPKEEELKKECEAPAAEAAAPPPPPPPPPEELEMRVFMHCEGCARKVRRSLKGFDGVEEVSTDCRTHKVVVKGKKAAEDPLKVVERVQKKTGRKVELLSPLPPPPEEKNEEEKPKAKEKKEEPVVIAVLLKVHMHCEACAQEIKKRILRMEGVQLAESNLKASHVSVKGVFDPPKLIEYIHKRTSKHATIIKAEPINKKPEVEKAKEEEKEKDEKKEGKKVEEEKKEGNKTEGEKKEDNKVEEGEGNDSKEDKKDDDKKAEGDKTEKEVKNDTKDEKELSAEEMAAAKAAAAVVAAAARMEQKRNELYYYYPTIPRYPVEYAAGYSAYPQNQHQVTYAHPQPLPPPQGTYAPQIFSDENPNACSVM